jgi:hypothetical protein
MKAVRDAQSSPTRHFKRRGRGRQQLDGNALGNSWMALGTEVNAAARFQ